jgi:hypothetical protein
MTEIKKAQPLIYSKISAVLSNINAIGKNNKNTQQNYKFRGIDDVYNELHSLFATHGIFTVPKVLEERTEEKTTKSGTNLIYRVLKIKYTFYAEDGSSVAAIVVGEGMDSGDKASNKAMAVAHKYALTQVFCIPTEEQKDPEHDSHEVVSMPSSDIPYTGTKEQKQTLVDICKEMHITDMVRIGKMHQELLNAFPPILMKELRATLITLLAANAI